MFVIVKGHTTGLTSGGAPTVNVGITMMPSSVTLTADPDTNQQLASVWGWGTITQTAALVTGVINRNFHSTFVLIGNTNANTWCPIPATYVCARISNPGGAYTAGTVFIDTIEVWTLI
jgi:hypothetical protein